jgi:hypothetical protein
MLKAFALACLNPMRTARAAWLRHLIWDAERAIWAIHADVLTGPKRISDLRAHRAALCRDLDQLKEQPHEQR